MRSGPGRVLSCLVLFVANDMRGKSFGRRLSLHIRVHPSFDRWKVMSLDVI